MPDFLPQLRSALADHYTIERELGRGGMATVYLAQDLRHDRPVALKVLHPELAATLGPERFQREIRLAARLQLPHILTVHDSGEIPAEGRGPAVLWFTMPFVEGESLRDRLNREKQLSVEDALRIAREAAEALDYAHRHGVIHRDVKPENILLTESHALVADFGIARGLSTGGDRLTETGMAVGTPAYMSPEQASGAHEVDARSDIYALGCVLYEMLAGEAPFTGPTPQAILAKRFTGEVPSMRPARPTVPDAVEQAVIRALAVVPADRYASAADFARALAPMVVTAPGVSSVAAPPRRAGVKFLGQRPLFATLMLGIVIGGGALFAWRRMHGSPDVAGPRRIAVLPFENLGAPDDEYFADGITDEVRGKLTGLSGLEVTARSSSNQYRKTGKTPADIGRELGVDYLLTGTVRWERGPGGGSGGRVKVSPELIQVSSGSAKWQQPFDASLTDVFQVQADIAGRVAQALNVALADSARQRLAEKPTTNEEAYTYYLRGKSYAERAVLNVEPQTMAIAQQMYEKAIALDPDFALAWARLSGLQLYFYRRDPSDGVRLAKAKEAAKRALDLKPGLAEAHVAMGEYLETAEHDRDRAMAQYATALNADPNNAELLASVGWNQALRGQLDSAVANLRLAAELDPRSAERALGYADISSWHHRYPEADTLFDRAIALAPDQYHAYYDKAENLLSWKGDVEGARRVMQEAERRIGQVEFVKKMCVACFDWTGPLAADYERILDALSLDGFSTRDSLNYFVARAERARVHQRPDEEHRYWASAGAIAERQARSRPDEPRFHDQLADIYAGLGRRVETAQEHRRYEELKRAARDTAYLKTEIPAHWAVLHVRFGEYDAAIDSLRSALADTSLTWISIPRLRVDPFWTPLRGKPAFEALLH